MNVTSPIKVRQRALVLLGSLGPLGYLPASGTITVATVGVAAFFACRGVPIPSRLVALVVFSAAAVWLHHLGDRILGEKDSRKLVWDELVGYWIAVSLLPFSWRVAAIAFLVERAIDITKVPPARWIERTWPGGLGDVGDDIVAGVYTCGLLHLLTRLWPEWMGAI